MLLAVIESFVLNFALLLVCVVNIQNGAVGGVHYYEQQVQQRVVELGLITEKEIKRNLVLSSLVFLFVLLAAAPFMVFYVNHAVSFSEGFIQLTVMYLLCGLFDRIFIDWYWVGHTRAWLIAGTEDLMPYIHKSSWVKKITGTVIGYPLLAALLAWIFTFFQ